MHELLRRPERRPHLVGVVHLLATPGAPAFEKSLDAILERALDDARALAEGGADGVIVENFGDAPFFPERVPAETVATMAVAVARIRAELGALPVGVNVLRNDARAALGLCAATGASFVRVNVHTGAMVTDQGLIEGRAAETLRERARLVPHVAILADVHVKHATPLGAESLEDAAEETWRRGRADVLIASGARTGAAPEEGVAQRIKERVPEARVWIGSGVTAGNASRIASGADGVIVGTSLKREGRVDEPVERGRVEGLREALERIGG